MASLRVWRDVSKAIVDNDMAKADEVRARKWKKHRLGSNIRKLSRLRRELKTHKEREYGNVMRLERSTLQFTSSTTLWMTCGSLTTRNGTRKPQSCTTQRQPLPPPTQNEYLCAHRLNSKRTLTEMKQHINRTTTLVKKQETNQNKQTRKRKNPNRIELLQVTILWLKIRKNRVR